MTASDDQAPLDPSTLEHGRALSLRFRDPADPAYAPAARPARFETPTADAKRAPTGVRLLDTGVIVALANLDGWTLHDAPADHAFDTTLADAARAEDAVYEDARIRQKLPWQARILTPKA